jgi:3'-phosphoadenosine 5'-phosphosulfate (PAPS) 3'-phosphatase
VEALDAICHEYNSPFYDTFGDHKLIERNGIGSIMCDLIEGRGDLHLNFAPDYNMWDVCGPTAILMSRLGYCADSKGMPIQFESRRNQYNLW